MVQLLVIATFVSFHLHDAGDGSAFAPVPFLWAVIWGGTLTLWSFVQAVAWSAGRTIDRTGRAALVRRVAAAQSLARFVGAAGLVYAVLAAGWLRAVRGLIGDWILLDELLAALPLLALLAGTWWSVYPIERRLREAALWRDLHADAPLHAPATRARHVLDAVRHQLLLALIPVALVTAWNEAVVLATPRIERAVGDAGTVLSALHWGGLALVLLLTPVLLRWTWDTVAMGRGDLADLARSLCTLHRVRIRALLVWRTRGTIVNGAILGLVYPFRYMLLTDALLERLPRREVEAVMAHEVAHVRRHHMPWLAAAILSIVLASGWAVSLGALLLRIPVTDDPGRGGDALNFAAAALGLVLVAAVFGWVSRRFEWQADAFAARHLAASSLDTTMTPEAAGIMAAALQSVADLNGMPIRRFSWRHGSIHERQRRLAALVGRPLNRLPIDRQVRWIKAAAALLLVASLLPFLWGR